MGVLAMAAPMATGIAVTVVVGVILLAAGLTQTMFAFKAERFGEGVLKFLFGGISIVAGAMVISEPLVGLASLTMVVAIYFVLDGITSIIGAFSWKPLKGWGWMLFGGVAAIALAWMILSDWPVSGAWAIPLLVGIRLIFRGWSLIMLGATGDAVADEVEEALG
jgi:uncharacterized membrane protein HdeD (DUF308 family)